MKLVPLGSCTQVAGKSCYELYSFHLASPADAELEDLVESLLCMNQIDVAKHQITICFKFEQEVFYINPNNKKNLGPSLEILTAKLANRPVRIDIYTRKSVRN